MDSANSAAPQCGSANGISLPRRSYAEFLASKAIDDPMTGLTDIPDLPAALFPFQRDIVAWALRRGRAALLAGTGLGKSLMELAWGQAICDATGGMVLLFAPLAVAAQMLREAEKFGIPARVVSCQAECAPGINITNYQKLSHFDLSLFVGVILDESSILKSTTGHYRTALIEACRQIPFRLAATATPAPNDFMELGNHAEFLGTMSYTDMLATFFSHDGGSTQKWRLKGHAEDAFWAWMASWAVMLRKPSDLGYSDDGYELPPLHYHQHDVAVDAAPAEGQLFALPAVTLSERITARKISVTERVAAVVNIVFDGICGTLDQWDGKPNTQSEDANGTIQTPKSDIADADRDAVQSKTPTTCANITPSAAQKNERLSNKQKLIAADASDMPPTPTIEKHASNRQNLANQKLGGHRASRLITASAKSNTTPSSSSRVDAAQSVAQGPSADFSLITAMKVAKSEGCFAVPATLASAISRMTQNGSIEPWCIWCNLNSEQDALAKAFGRLAFSVNGSMADDQKERAILNWIAGDRPIIISKPSIMGFGMNFQHCRNTAFVGLNDSWEQFYQAVRRFWRFGQSRAVNCHMIAAETEGATVANLRRKEADADRMAAAMVRHMADLSSANVRGTSRTVATYAPSQRIILPSFLKDAA